MSKDESPEVEPSGAAVESVATEDGIDETVKFGIFDRFDSYRTPQEEDYRSIFSDGFVVLDTNVLLNLYRYTTAARRDFMDALTLIGPRLWIPHQVMVEFWRNREGVLKGREDSGKDLIEQAEGSYGTLQGHIRHWAKRISISEEQLGEVEASLRSGIDAVIEHINQLTHEESAPERDTEKDSILASIASLLDGRVGEKLDSKERTDAEKEAERRISSKVPPGFMDRKKGDAKVRGDYLVWRQTLLEARKRSVDVLIITADTKEDWWRFDGRGNPKAPRNELCEEILEFAGVRVFILQPGDFLKYANQLLDVPVEVESLLSIDNVDKVSQSGPEFSAIGVLEQGSLWDDYFSFLQGRGFYLFDGYPQRWGFDMASPVGRLFRFVFEKYDSIRMAEFMGSILSLFDLAEREGKMSRSGVTPVVVLGFAPREDQVEQLLNSGILVVCRNAQTWAGTGKTLTYGLASVAIEQVLNREIY
ncbi:PIN-like domain-containing protein [Umezawaea endophytica]|uniref:PIN-like domain-containing protein n=1 Tax=Umezawaea endophytica TaxID=1654476 RepID=A0A9X2VGI2_9PSEU|nr:PIN-like domain-containing protein [Umezawaea endophytica]MCS7476215.1 PIN-like domain-containing protein [Umezawaea endophytica]